MIFATLMSQAFKAKRILVITYSAIGLSFILLYLAVFPSVQSQSANYNKIFASLPKGLLVGLNITNVSPTLMGYLSSKHFGFVWLLIMILFIITYASYAIAKEIESKTIGLLLSQPIERTKLYLARLSTGILGLIIFICFSEVIVWPLASAFHYAVDVKSILILGIAGVLFGLSILCLSFMFSAICSSAARVSAYTGGILFIMYGFFIGSSLSGQLDGLKYLSLFHYISPGSIISDNSIPLSSICVYLLLSLITTLIGVTVFKRRQIQA